MMNLIRQIKQPALLVLLMIILLPSCQKELHPPGSADSGGTDTANTPVDSIYINSITRLKRNAVGDFDTLAITRMAYDAARRFTGWRDYAVHNTDYLQSFEFFYNGNDSLPNRARYSNTAQPFTDSTIEFHYFYYNTTAQKIKDSVAQTVSANPQQEGWVDLYYYLPGRIVTVGKYQNPTTLYLYKDTAFLDASGNIIRANSYNGPADVFLMDTQFQYDNKVHPFSLTNIYKAIPKNIGGGLPHKYSALNNIVYQKTNIPVAGYVEEIHNAIVYNSKNLPVEITITKSSGEIFKLLLSYRAF